MDELEICYTLADFDAQAHAANLVKDVDQSDVVGLIARLSLHLDTTEKDIRDKVSLN